MKGSARTLAAGMPGLSYLHRRRSLLRRVHRELGRGPGGPVAALLMQAAHPVAFAGFFAHTGALDDPYGDLRRTARRSWTRSPRPAAAGGRPDRRRSGRCTAPSAASCRAGAALPAGTPYAPMTRAAAVDPRGARRLRAPVVYERYVGPARATHERDGVLADYRVIGAARRPVRHTTCPDVAGSRYCTHGVRRPAGAEARELATRIVLRPPVAAAASDLLRRAGELHHRRRCCRGDLRRAVRAVVGPGARARPDGGAEYAEARRPAAAAGAVRSCRSARCAA